MKFVISASYLTRGESVLIQYPKLKEYEHEIVDEELYITVCNLEDVVKLSKQIKKNLIIDTSEKEIEIVIYDGYIE